MKDRARIRPSERSGGSLNGLKGRCVGLEIVFEIIVILHLCSAAVHVPRHQRGIEHFDAGVTREERQNTGMLATKAHDAVIEMETRTTSIEGVDLSDSGGNDAGDRCDHVLSVSYHFLCPNNYESERRKSCYKGGIHISCPVLLPL